MRLTLSLILIAAAALVGGSFLNVARSAEGSAPRPVAAAAPGPAAATAHRLRTEADRRRQARTERLVGSICTGCGGPVVPFDPSGGAEARAAVAAGARTAR